jgi:hypothetical protein
MKEKKIILNLPIFLKPKKKYLLERLGKNNDGGYLVCPTSIKNSSSLIALGINDDWSFEEDFLKKNKSISIIYFDPNTSLSFLIKIFAKKLVFFFYYKTSDIIYSFVKLFKFFFIKKKLVNKYVSYGDILKFTKNIKTPLFFKIDIEGSEYRILKDLIKIKKKISGLIIEFHNIDLFIDDIKNFIKNIGLKLIHVHANNTIEHITKTNVLELTFSKNPTKISNIVNFPHSLDQKNYLKNKEIKINFKSKLRYK